MRIAKVIGTVTSTIKNDAFRGAKILVVQPLDLQRQPSGRAYLAVDTVDAGVDDTVLITDEGRAARDVLNNPNAPVRSLIVGVVDRWDVMAVEETGRRGDGEMV